MYQAIVFLPLLGCLIAGFFGRVIGARPSELVTTLFLFVSGDPVLDRVRARRLRPYRRAHRADDLDRSPAISRSTGRCASTRSTAVMLVVVTTVSALVHLYSIGYMEEDPHRPRFFAYLSLFTFAMLALVTADNLAQMFFGWEGVGLASYLLIGFWYHKPEANAAAIKAFIVNRVGDFGFALGIFAVFMMTKSIDFDIIFAQAPALAGKTINFFGWQADALTLICLLLFMGAMGKSAQFLLHTWLPDAMEGPTPVSALIHAATMVTAGVFMVARLSPLFELAPNALTVVTFIGATTAFFAATVGLVQNDIKRIVAYSTCSQLGYMFVAMGVGAYSVGMLHLFTHAFFKALLFLGSGSVIHAMHHEQDIRHMGGLRKKIPFTYWMMVIGTLALTGFPFTAGYFSKDAIIEAAYAGRNPMALYAFIMTVVAAALTSFYSWRLIFKTFHGEPHDRHHYEEAHESPLHHAGAARRSGGRLDPRRLSVQGIFRRASCDGILPQVDQVRRRQHHHQRHASRAARGDADADGDDGVRLRRVLVFLYPRAVDPGRARAPAQRALSLPAQQMVFRRDLRLPASCARPNGSAPRCGSAATAG